MSLQRIRSVSRRGHVAAALAVVGFFALVGGAIAKDAVAFYGKPGTKAPPAKLGGFAMKPFPADSRTNGGAVTFVHGPTGKVRFSPTLTHVKVGAGWSYRWGHAYTAGDVYYTNSNSITLTLPTGVKAFYFYAQPYSQGTYPITATADGANSGPLSVTGGHGSPAAARYFGFYAVTKSARVTKVTVSISGEPIAGLAIGQFGIH